MEPCSKALVRPGDDLFNDLPEFTHLECISQTPLLTLSEVQIRIPGKEDHFQCVRECAGTDLLVQSQGYFVLTHKA